MANDEKKTNQKFHKLGSYINIYEGLVPFLIMSSSLKNSSVENIFTGLYSFSSGDKPSEHDALGF